MKQLICRALAWLDRFLLSRTIPVAHFGYEKLGETEQVIGGPVQYGRWHWPEEWREPFYKHNRRLSEMAIMVRKMRNRVASMHLAPRALMR